MNKRVKWTDIDDVTRQYILKRDKKCLICGRTNELTLAHIFLSRAKGGKGCKENLVTICKQDHYFLLDNPIGKKNNELSKRYKERLKAYLIVKENIKYNDEFIESLRYKKWHIKKQISY